MRFSRVIFIFCLLAVISLACSIPGVSGLTATDTPIPTNTLAPSQTPLPTSTAVSIPTQLPTDQITSSTNPQSGNEDITVIADSKYSVDTWNYIVGIVQNNTTDTIEYIELSVLIYDESGSLIATENVYPFLDKIASGENSPFAVYLDSWSEGTSYDFLVEGYNIAEEPIPTELEILTHNSYNDEYDLNIVGEIQNNSDKIMSYVKIAAALYSADGTLLNTNYSYAMINNIAAGAKSPLKIWFSDAWEDAESYEIQVQGSYDDYATVLPIQVTDYQFNNEEYTCTVTGNVKNVGTTEISYASVVAVFYDNSNTVIEAEWNYMDVDTIPAGSTSSFTITTYTCPEYDHMEVYAGN